MGWAEVPFKATPLPVNGGPGTDDDGTGHGARLAAILAAVEAAGKPGFIVIDTTTYSPVGANGPDDPGWFGTVIDVSVSPTQY